MTVRNAEAPNEVGDVGDVGDVFLVGFWCKDDHGQPAAEVRERAYPTHIKKIFELGVNDGGFVDTILRGLTSHWGGGACINAEFIVETRAVNAFSSEGVPVFVDNRCEAVAVFEVKCWGNSITLSNSAWYCLALQRMQLVQLMKKLKLLIVWRRRVEQP